MKLRKKGYEGYDWTPSAGITAEQAEKVLDLFPEVVDGTSLNELAFLVDRIIDPVRPETCPNGWLVYRFRLRGGIDCWIVA